MSKSNYVVPSPATGAEGHSLYASRSGSSVVILGVGAVGVGISWVNVGLHTLCTGGGSGSGLERGGQDTGQGGGQPWC